MNLHIDINALDAWAEATTANIDVQEEVKDLCRAFLSRYTCMVIEKPTDNHDLMMRVYRSAIILKSSGGLLSTEFIRIRNHDFLKSQRERLQAIQEATWGNKARPFNDRPNADFSSNARSLLDASIIPSLNLDADIQLRQFESHIGIRLRHSDTWRHVTIEKSPMVFHLLPDIRTSLRENLFRILISSRQDSFEIFREKLPQDVLETLFRCGVNDLASWNWLMGAEVDATAQTARNRQQATKIYPILFRALSSRKTKISTALENAEPLIPIIAEVLRTDIKIIKKINNLCCEGANLSTPPKTINEFKPIFKMVSYIGKTQNPKNVVEWQTYFALAKTTSRLAELLGETDEFISRYIGTGNLKAAPQKAREAQDDIQDAIMDIHVNLMRPVAEFTKQKIPTLQETTLKILGKRSLEQILDVCSWWHDNQAQIRIELSERFPSRKNRDVKLEWPSLHAEEGPWTCPSGLQAWPLTSEKLLVEEHVRMRHCVNQYADACRFSGRHIVSFRTNNGRTSVATAEFSQDILLPLVGKSKEPPEGHLGVLPPGCIQFKGVGNISPSTSAWACLWEYVSGIMVGDIGVDIHGLKDYRSMNVPRQQAEFGSYYNEQSALALETAWRLYAPMLPRSARQLPTLLHQAQALPEFDADPLQVPQVPGFG